MTSDDAGDYSRTPLAPRWRPLLLPLSRGKPNKTIAAELGLSLGTVKRYVSELMAALGVRNRTELALRLGTLLDAEEQEGDDRNLAS